MKRSHHALQETLVWKQCEIQKHFEFKMHYEFIHSKIFHRDLNRIITPQQYGFNTVPIENKIFPRVFIKKKLLFDVINR